MRISVRIDSAAAQAQLQAFIEASVRVDAERDARLLSLIAIGSRGDGRQLDKTLDRLTDQVQDHAHIRPHR